MDSCDRIPTHPVKYERNPIEDCRMKMSQDIPEKFVFKEEQSLFRYCDGNLNFSTASQEDDDYNYHKKKMSRDPMSHRIIEKRRRDRMNNCLADLSRLIPADYLKKGRGRIEKTEIIEMAIKHMRHLQSIIANTRLNEPADSTSSSPPVTLTAPPRDSTSTRQPINIEHYRLGYLECLSEAMHFLVEVQGYFAGDSLCVQMINHLHKHCDKLLKGDALNFPRKNNGEISSSNSSTSTTNGNYSNNSPPLGMSNSTGSNSDDNQIPQTYENSRQFESLVDTYKSIQNDFRPERRYSEMCYPSGHPPQKQNSEPFYSRYMEPKLDSSENRSDSDLEQNYALNPRNNEFRKEECVKNYVKNNYLPRNYSISSGIGSNVDGTVSYEEMMVKEENPDGTSQLREMLTSPKSLAQFPNSTGRNLEIKRNASPMSHTSGCETSSSHHHVSPSHPDSSNHHHHHHHHQPDVINYKTQNLAIDVNDSNGDQNHNSELCSSEGFSPENHNNMYKFKNTIKQRFSKENDFKEKRSYDSPEPEDLPVKKQKVEDFHHFNPNYDEKVKYPDPLTKERLHLLDRHEGEKEKMRTDLRFNTSADLEHKRRNRYASESDIHGEIDPIASRLSFGHKSNDRSKRWEEPSKFNPKLKNLSPNPMVPMYNLAPSLEGVKKSMGLLATAEFLNEASPLMSNKFNKLSISTSESNVGIPIFALHTKGSFYIPLTLDQSALAQFLSVLGVTKSDEPEEKTVLHPVTISVNFQSHVVKDLKPAITPWKCAS